MKQSTRLQIIALASAAGATWRLVRESRHFVIDFERGGKIFRHVIANTPSDRRALANVAADLRRSLRRWLTVHGVQIEASKWPLDQIAILAM